MTNMLWTHMGASSSSRNSGIFCGKQEMYETKPNHSWGTASLNRHNCSIDLATSASTPLSPLAIQTPTIVFCFTSTGAKQWHMRTISNLGKKSEVTPSMICKTQWPGVGRNLVLHRKPLHVKGGIHKVRWNGAGSNCFLRVPANFICYPFNRTPCPP
jgi:hypothetical protein